MCMGSSPAPVVRREEPRRDMTFAYKDAGLEKVKVPSVTKKDKTEPKPKQQSAAQATKSPLNIG